MKKKRTTSKSNTSTKNDSVKNTVKKGDYYTEIVLPENLSVYLTPLSILVAATVIAAAILTIGAKSGNSFLPAARDNNDPIVAGAGEESPGVKAPNYDKIYDYAKEIGLDRSKLVKCVDDEKFAKEIEADLADGEKAGVQGTPGFIIGKMDSSGNVKGKLVAGAYPYEDFKGLFDYYLDGTEYSKLSDYEDASVKISLKSYPYKGNDKAKVAIVEFSDYECPFCIRHVKETHPIIEKDYIDKGKVLWVFRDYPLPFHNPVATKEAMIAKCAKDQGGNDAYFKVHDFIFNNTVGNTGGVQ